MGHNNIEKEQTNNTEQGSSRTNAAPAGNGYNRPDGAQRQMELHVDGRVLPYQAEADWIVLRKNEKPKAEMFHVSYTADAAGNDAVETESSKNNQQSDPARPITFVFNGGPGASSVYLHLGAVGPKRVECRDNGQPLKPPYPLIDNPQSWLQFTDLVFIDPVGTGFSRMIDENGSRKEGNSGSDNSKKGGSGEASSAAGNENGSGEQSEYWQVKRDLESLGEFMRSYLNTHHRWESPIYIAGESYGGFRTAKLAKMAQQDYGIGLNGVIIISPALEFTLLDGSDYDVLMWLDTFPTMAAAAYVHGKSRNVRKLNDSSSSREDLDAFRERAAEFAVNRLLPVLAAGNMFGEERKTRVLNQAADFLGLPRDIVRKKNGKVEIDYFVKNLLRSDGKHLGLYDATITVSDPYPDRDSWAGPDPTLHQLERVFAAGINTQLRKHIGLDTERDYNLLSHTVNKSWKIDTRKHALESQVGATDDLRYGMSLNPDMKVFLTHGIFDLVTPYFAAERISRLMKLSDEARKNLTLKWYPGGHMFYTRNDSRRKFYEDMKSFYSE